VSERAGSDQVQEAPVLDPGAEDDYEHGRVGYGRWARYSPLALGLLLIAAVAFIWFGQRSESPPSPSPGQATGNLAPDVTLTLLDGKKVDLASLRGNVVVLNFWASWCEPCRAEMPLLQAFWDAAQASSEKTEILGVGIRTDRDDDARAFVAQGNFTYPIGRDTDIEGPGIGPIEDAFGVPPAYPSTVIIRPDGIVDRYHLGPVNAEMLRLMVDEARREGE
jgi:peroxiredoxin